jgi:ABC-2 type transport system ATP-binding protein
MSISVKNTTKFYGKQKALDQVNFEIGSGEIVGFLGPNGAGKSTMMKILTTYISQDEGVVSVNGLDVVKEPVEVKRSVGYLPEHNPLYTDLYVKEYLGFHAGIHKIQKKRTEEVIEQVGLTPEMNKKIDQLSKGYRQRVGLAAALLHDPQVLVLDEPTTGLDPNQLLDIRNLIREVGKTKTVLLSTHIMQEVEAMCSRVIIINKGKIVADEHLEDLLGKQEQILEVEFDLRVEPELLKGLPHIQSVKNTRDNNWQITFVTKEDMRPKVFDFAQENGFKTLQMQQKIMNLENMFRNLTQ